MAEGTDERKALAEQLVDLLTEFEEDWKKLQAVPGAVADLTAAVQELRSGLEHQSVKLDELVERVSELEDVIDDLTLPPDGGTDDGDGAPDDGDDAPENRDRNGTPPEGGGGNEAPRLFVDRVPPGWPTKPRNFHPFFHGPITNNPGGWRAYGKALGTESGMFSMWAFQQRVTWDDIAGGEGGDLSVLDGQLGGSKIAAFFDQKMWNLERDPSSMVIYPVPREAGNWKESGKWTNPGVWEQIASGKYDSVYERLFGRLAWYDKKAGGDPRLRVFDIGHEATGAHYPHSIGPEVEAYKHAMVRIASIMYDRYETITGKRPLWLWRPNPALMFGNGKVRTMDACPVVGDARPDMVGLSLHMRTPIRVAADFEKYLHYPGPLSMLREGWLDFVEQARKRGFEWFMFPETGANNPQRTKSGSFPPTENMEVFARGLRDFLYRAKPLAMLYMNQGKHTVTGYAWGKPYIDLFGDPSQWKLEG